MEQREIVEIKSKDKKDEDMLPQVITTKALKMYRILGSFCLNTGTHSALELSRVLHHF
jgi:hypothetical protein